MALLLLRLFLCAYAPAPPHLFVLLLLPLLMFPLMCVPLRACALAWPQQMLSTPCRAESGCFRSDVKLGPTAQDTKTTRKHCLATRQTIGNKGSKLKRAVRDPATSCCRSW